MNWKPEIKAAEDDHKISSQLISLSVLSSFLNVIHKSDKNKLKMHNGHSLLTANYRDKNTRSKIITTFGGRYYLQYEINNNTKYVLLYQPISKYFFTYYEVLFHYYRHKKGDVGIIGSDISAVEAISYHKTKFNYDTNIYFIESKLAEEEKVFRQFFKYQLELDAQKKYSLMIDTSAFETNQDSHIEEDIMKDKLKACLLMFRKLELKGDFMLRIQNLLVNSHAELLSILASYFEKYQIHFTDADPEYRVSNVTIYLENYQGITDLQKFTNLYEKVSKTKGFIASMVSWSHPVEYPKIKNLNNFHFASKIHYLENIMNSHQMHDHVLNQSYGYARQYHFDTFEFYPSFMNQDFETRFLKNIYFVTEPTKFTFKVNHQLHLMTQMDYHQMLLNDDVNLELTKMIIDTRNINDWFAKKQAVRFYRPHPSFRLDLRDHVKATYQTGDISQAWLKMYEILNGLPLLDLKKKVIKTFHICESPGNFIKSINHYIKTNSHAEFKWTANSLNPNSKINQQIYAGKNTVFDDKFNLMKNYPDHWDFGPDGTGNILDPKVIDYYKNNIGPVDLITSDCGLPNDPDDEFSLMKLHVKQVLLILKIIKKKSSFVAKFFFPLRSRFIISLFQILYESFEFFDFFKPSINIFSSEFYIIGRNFHSINDDIVKSIEKNLENFDPDVMMVTKFDETFLQQLALVHHRMVDEYIFNFKKQLYYVDYHSLISDDFVRVMKEIIRNKNVEWCQQNNLTPIEEKYRL